MERVQYSGSWIQQVIKHNYFYNYFVNIFFIFQIFYLFYWGWFILGLTQKMDPI